MAFDERKKAEAMSALYKTEHYERVLKSGDMERCLPNFAWHLDMVTKNLKPFILTLEDKNKFEMPEKYDCISKNFWF